MSTAVSRPSIHVVMTGFTLRSREFSPALSAVYLIRGRRTLLVDTGSFNRREQLHLGLSRLGLELGDIDAVILTHAHFDHAQNIDLFEGKPVYLHAAELDYIRHPAPADFATERHVADVLSRQNLVVVDGERELEPGVRLIELPGHSPGHMGVLVQTADGTAVIAGDASPNARTLLDGCPYLVFGDEQDARKSCARLRDEAELFYCGHDRPFALRAGEVRYLEQPGLDLTMMIHPLAPDVHVTLATASPKAVWVMPRA
ncbi:MAG TPA: N-acyl homoserine lactonase family protein [Bacillota bacterium]